MVSITAILIVLVILLMFGALPQWRSSGKWGYGPTSGLGLILMILVILFIAGRI